jgi:glutamate formiminotransferase / formiminotetrahydrofolate cyclodeaminase
MPNPIVECIPNFSDARRPEVIDAIITEIKSVPGVHLLDRHSDMDHNRTVLTMIGHPDGIENAAFLAIKKAAELIDLAEHTGAHPRIGATDVVPFVPISDISMVECVEMARRLGKKVGEELGIPVYLYEEAAAIPERQNLENIRKGQYEGLKEEVLVNLARKPDFGPAKLGSAGATVIGARAPLIAFNVYLTTSDVTIAQKIAKVMRNSSGGYRFVKAMGVLVDGLAQVSMNLTNFKQSPIARIVETIRREAQRYGVAIHHSELVGLTPQQALLDSAVWYTQLDNFKNEQILENRMFEVLQEGSMPALPAQPDFLEQLASSDPTPGGGSAAAHTGAAAAALVTMVGRVTVGKKKYAPVESQMLTMIEKSESLRKLLTDEVEEDAASFDGIINAMRMPKVTPQEIETRLKAVDASTRNAAMIPHKVAGLCLEVLELAVMASQLGNINAISDAASAGFLAQAALRCAVANVKINIKSLQNPQEMDYLVIAAESLENESEKRVAEIRKNMVDRAGF